MRRFTWWKIVVGLLLVLIEAKHFMHPESLALKPDNTGEAFGMAVTQAAFFLVGIYLLYSGMRGSTTPGQKL